jgi:hypothetical protein
MSLFVNRIIRALRLDKELYEEVEADKTATPQAMAVVILSSVAGGLGAGGISGFQGIFWGCLAALVGWIIWAFLTYLVGTKMLPTPQTRSDPGELLRTLGFAYSPGLLSIFCLVPVLGPIVRLIIPFWMLIAWVIAVRQALDYTSTARAVAVCIIGWLILVIITVFLHVLFPGAQPSL